MKFYYGIRAPKVPEGEEPNPDLGPALLSTWHDCRAFVADGPPREFRQFTDFESAMIYAFGSDWELWPHQIGKYDEKEAAPAAPTEPGATSPPMKKRKINLNECQKLKVSLISQTISQTRLRPTKKWRHHQHHGNRKWPRKRYIPSMYRSYVTIYN